MLKANASARRLIVFNDYVLSIFTEKSCDVVGGDECAVAVAILHDEVNAIAICKS
jgi:hypothetical protein